MPPFPAKTWTTPTDAVWMERCSALNAYFHAALSRPRLAQDQGLRETFERTPDAEDWEPVVVGTVATEEDEEERFKFVDANGLRFGYIDKGNVEDPLVLFVHGFPDTLWSWEEAMKRVASEGFYCVSMAQRGYYPTALVDGDSDYVRFNKRELGRDVLGVISGLQRRGAVLVGHDFGAVAAWAAAVLDQEAASGLVAKVVGEAVPPPKAMALKPSLILKGSLGHSYLAFIPPLNLILIQFSPPQ